MTVNAAGPQVNLGAFSQQAYQQNLGLCGSLYNTLSATAGTIAAGIITGALSVFAVFTNAVPGTQTTRTAAQLYADLLLAFGATALPTTLTYDLQITNTGAGTLTLAGGTGVTVTGTATIAQNTTRQFVVQVTSPTTVVITSVGTGTYS